MTAAVAAPAASPDPAPPTDLRRAPTPGRRGPLRLVVRPAPRREPPFDDELDGPSPVGPYDQRLPFVADSEALSIRLTRRRDRFASRATARAALPDPQPVTRRLVIGIIEVATGRRPASQLSSLTTAPVQCW